ncbi:MAG: hypothetical protein LH481_17250 [Burkholderiales bacterium]|nr:hypothetical protein [Burkholderiales bacterium]
MESFVIRIYRRTDAGQPAVVGTLESIATGKRSAFHNQDELQAMFDADIIGGKQGAARDAGSDLRVVK